tara:strand:- start:194 stop:634 length:441 start_codon:yes stop_codon:yes gene_type:complete
MIKDLIKLSQNLKALGHIKQANVIEGVITKVHGKGPEEPVEADDQAVCVHCDESHHMGDDHQCAEESGSKHSDSYMAKPQLNKIQEYAKKLHDELEDGEQLDDWMESHIAKMDQMIGDVYHKYSYKNKKELMENPSLVIANRKKKS